LRDGHNFLVILNSEVETSFHAYLRALQKVLQRLVKDTQRTRPWRTCRWPAALWWGGGTRPGSPGWCISSWLPTPAETNIYTDISTDSSPRCSIK